jgi:hypothetical protein
MWRVILVIVLVLTLDVCLFLLEGETLDTKLGSAIRARAENPTAENQRLLDKAWQEHENLQRKLSAWFTFAIILVTANGFFIAGRELERRRIQQAPP